MSSQPSISTEYARVRITADVQLDTQQVQMAFILTGATEPGTGDWKTATWLSSAGLSRVAGVLVGPGALVLAAGRYRVWWRLTDSPEIPARQAGWLEIT